MNENLIQYKREIMDRLRIDNEIITQTSSEIMDELYLNPRLNTFYKITLNAFNCWDQAREIIITHMTCVYFIILVPNV